MAKENGHKLTKAYSFIFYTLSLFVGFFTGGLYVIVTGAAKNQGLAAGAIAAVYAMGFAFVFALISILFAYLLSKKTIIILNWIFLVLLLIHIGIIIHRFNERAKMETVSAVVEQQDLLDQRVSQKFQILQNSSI